MTPKLKNDGNQDLDLIADTAIVRQLGVTSMTLWRWSHDPALGFPKLIKIRRRNYRSAKALADWQARMVRQTGKAVRP